MKGLLEQYGSISRKSSAKKRPADSISSSAVTNVPPPIKKQQQSGVVSIYFLCNEGSVTHYFHFLFGALMPLIEYHLATKRSTFSIMTDIGPMKSILCEMPFNIVEICGPSEDDPSGQQRKAHDDKSAYAALQLEPGDVQLPAYDSFAQRIFENNYVPKMSSRSRKQALSFLANYVPRYIAAISPVKIILIERKNDPYYQEVKDPNRSDVYSSNGSQRRCIGNHSELAAALSSRFNKDFENISLERTSIYYQYHVFHSASVVIAQHGAALANAFFMAENSNIIEISPRACRDRQHFRNLATVCKLGYSVVHQEEDNGHIDISDVLQHVERCISLC